MIKITIETDSLTASITYKDAIHAGLVVEAALNAMIIVGFARSSIIDAMNEIVEGEK